MRWQQFSLQVLLLRLVLLLPEVTSSTEVLNPSKVSTRAGINFFQTPVNVDIQSSSYESQMFLVAPRMMKSFPECFQLTLPRSIRGITIYGSDSQTKCIS